MMMITLRLLIRTDYYRYTAINVAQSAITAQTRRAGTISNEPTEESRNTQQIRNSNPGAAPG